MSLQLPFKKSIHRTYNKTFLQGCLVIITYDKFETEDDFANLWQSYCETAFGINAGAPDYLSGITFDSEDKSQQYFFSDTSAAVRFNIKGYKGFVDSVVPGIVRLVDFIKRVAKITLVKSIFLSKRNLWQTKSDLNSPHLRDAYINMLFSDAFLHDDCNIAQIEGNELSIGAFRKLQWTNKRESLSMLACFDPSNEIPNNGLARIALFSNYILSSEEAEIPVDQIQTNLLEMNKTLFDAYEWSISDVVRQIMLS